MLEPEERKRGMEAIRSWYKSHPKKNDFVIVSGSEEDSWTPTRILEVLEKREKTGNWGQSDIPELILESIAKIKKYKDT